MKNSERGRFKNLIWFRKTIDIGIRIFVRIFCRVFRNLLLFGNIILVRLSLKVGGEFGQVLGFRGWNLDLALSLPSASLRLLLRSLSLFPVSEFTISLPY